MTFPPNHPAFLQPDDPSVIIWRYVDMHKFEWLLENRRLFMPSASRLGDPLEGSTPCGELAWWRRQAEDADTEEHRRIIEHNRSFLSYTAQSFRDHYYVSCWHTNTYENHAMWGCYTKEPEAVAVRTTFGALRRCVPEFVGIGMVRYIDYARQRLPTMNMFEYIMHKDSYYAFESEVRAVAFPPTADELGKAEFFAHLFESESDTGFRVYAPVVDLAVLIHGIVVHPYATPAFFDAVRELCAGHRLPAPEFSRKNRPAEF
jgi:hypothetical protein